MTHRPAEETVSALPGSLATGSSEDSRPRLGASPVVAPQQIVAGRYQVVRFIGQGGMGQVFEAVDHDLRQTVAIKLLHPEVAHSEELRERMRSEVLLARRIAHPAVCRVFDLFRHTEEGHDGTPRELLGIAMECLPGETLAARLQRPFSRAMAQRWMADLAQALTAAHEQGVVHLDLKPSNVLMVHRRGRGCAVLADFGVARALAERARHAAPGKQPGTPAFLAPEVMRGEEPSPAADVFSLGKLIECIVGAVGRLPERSANGWSEHALRRWRRTAAGCCRGEPLARIGSPAAVAKALGAGPRTPMAGLAAGAALAGVGLIIALLVGGRRAGDPRTAAAFRSAIARGEAALAEGRLEAARAECREAAHLSSELGNEATVRAEACRDEAAGRLEEAAAGYRALWTLSPRDLHLAVALARLESRLGRGRQALEAIDGIERPSSPEEELRLALAEALAAGAARAPARQAEAAARAQELTAGSRSAPAGWADLLRAEALLRTAQLDAARPLIHQAAEVFEAAGHRIGSARVELANADLLRAEGDRDAAAERYAAAAEAFQQAGDPALAARVLREAAFNDLERGRSEGARASCERAIEMLRPTGEVYELAYTEAVLGRVLQLQGESEEGRRRLEAALAGLERLGAERAAADVGYLLAELEVRLGRLGAARERVERTIELRRLDGHLAGEVMASVFLTWLEVEAGDVTAAAATIDEALAHLSEMADDEMRATVLAMAAIVRTEQDLLEDAQSLTEAAADRLEPGRSTATLAQILNVQGEIARARGDGRAQARAAEEALRMARVASLQEVQFIGEVNLADVLLDRGDAEPAREHLRRATALPEATGMPLTALIVGRVSARLRAAEGDLQGALVDLEHLRRRAAEAGYGLQLGEIELVLVEVLSRAGRSEQARAEAASLVLRARDRGQARLERLARERLAELSELNVLSVSPSGVGGPGRSSRGLEPLVVG